LEEINNAFIQKNESVVLTNKKEILCINFNLSKVKIMLIDSLLIYEELLIIKNEVSNHINNKCESKF